ncbi:helix-loop-helix DNA-binding domain-containing protein [Sparassis latifolia]
MSSFFAQSFKPQVVSRQEGFHPLPSPDPPSPSSPFDSNANANNHHLFMSPFLPDPFRKFPAVDAHLDPFSDDLASFIGSAPSPHHHAQSSQHAQSNERSTQSPAYDDYRPPPHNIFDISAPTPHHSHQQAYQQQQQQQQQQGAHAYSLPPASALHPHGLHDFTTHAHFNSTLPALGSSMRYEPPPASAGADPASVPSFSSSHLSSLSTFPDFHMPPSGRTPSPHTPAAPPHAASFSRSRSRSRPPTAHPHEPPSTNGGPARRTRAKRGSLSSVSPPPLHRGHTQPLVIPGPGSAVPLGARAPASPLGLHSATGSGWFLPGPGEFLPTPDSVHGGFSAFTGPASMSSVGGATALGVSPKDSPVAESAPPPGDVAMKHRALLANEKRRRRRESHNAVERRRRDNINEKISELATLIPECLLDPNATLTMPASLSASGEDLLFGGAPAKEKDKDKGAASPAESANGKEDKDGSAEPEDGAGAVVKANKGMILRKSVEYIRYLQQLVSAQASRNRDLEQQLSAFRVGGGAPSSSSSSAAAAAAAEDELGALMLHEEVDAFGFFAGIGGAPHAKRQRARLERVDETQMEVDDASAATSTGEENDGDNDNEMADASASLPSPDPDPDEDAGAGASQGQEEVRGRRGRPGAGGVGGPVKVNGVKKEGDMES